MRSAHSRVAFAALDNLIADHYIHSMTTEKSSMTFQDAVDHLTRSGESLLEALHIVQSELDTAAEEGDEPRLSQKDILAYRMVLREMQKAFA